MRRRSFLQSLFSTVFLPLVRTQPQPSDPRDGPTYTDSDGNPPSVLVALHDHNRIGGGVIYEP